VIDAVDFSEGFNEVNGVAFVAPELRPDSMSIDRYPHSLKILATEKQKAQNISSRLCLCASLWPIYFLPAAEA
jgi:hypothetical protein